MILAKELLQINRKKKDFIPYLATNMPTTHWPNFI